MLLPGISLLFGPDYSMAVHVLGAIMLAVVPVVIVVGKRSCRREYARASRLVCFERGFVVQRAGEALRT